MRKYKAGELKELARKGLAVDVTNYSFDQINELRQVERLSQVGYACGTYGIQGALLESDNGNWYVVTARSAALFQLV